MLQAYDKEKCIWLKGEEARQLLLDENLKYLKLLLASSGLEYYKFISKEKDGKNYLMAIDDTIFTINMLKKNGEKNVLS